MSIVIEREHGLRRQQDERFGLECPYCGVYAHMTPQSVPDAEALLSDRPKQIGIVYQCDACKAPVFLRFAVREYTESGVELFQNFIELERPKERFSFSYLPEQTEVMFREALSCFSSGNFNAFASMCRRAAESSYEAMGENGKLQAYDEMIAAQEIADIDENSFEPIKRVLFDTGDGHEIPMINRAQAGVLLEILKDMFYQSFVRRGKLTRALKVRHFFLKDQASELRPSA
jgi:hypothetical protein